ncbi:Dehydration-responsive element binding factor [Melia azedarach]|uniref:Dehydration-responsive element binding factor n=1 Tax=Melia azedarach TaxID=155640 RepID=A0ACC1XRU1_MELAZ|nr:Dehydration-responsive element binding factor [Melia azedarach]
MEIFSQVSDPLPLGCLSGSMDRPESSSLSDASSAIARRTAHSDEEVILASSRPKKRAGRRVFKETRHPIFRGVRRRNNNKWVCELREPNKKSRIWLGTYPTPEMAARAHDVAALALRGKSACLNYADSAWRLPLPASKDAIDIRKAAAEAAEAFRPREFEEVSDIKACSESEERCNCQNSYEVEKIKTLQENRYLGDNSNTTSTFIDEEAMFDMPGLLVNMAEGLLLSPPPLLFGDDDMNWNHGIDHDAGISLWNHSI